MMTTLRQEIVRLREEFAARARAFKGSGIGDAYTNVVTFLGSAMERTAESKQFVADPTALRESLIPTLVAWGIRSRHGEWTDKEARADCAADLVKAAFASGVVQPREDAVREARDEVVARVEAIIQRAIYTGQRGGVVHDIRVALARPTDDGTPGGATCTPIE